jgi:23S rRNA (uridine2552-2'-O)-methyltransferase
MAKRSKSSKRWLAEHFSDEYVLRAQREGLRSRAAFKLEEIDQRDRLLRPGVTVLDLGAAPGGWSEYAAKRLRGASGKDGRVLATDILPMEPLPGVEFVQGDFTQDEVLAEIRRRLGADPVDLVLSDMAPNMSGVDDVDQARAMHLAELALDLARQVLRPGGDLLVKAFQGAGYEELVKAARAEFETVAVRKPKASRSRSNEVYLLARKRKRVDGV